MNHAHLHGENRTKANYVGDVGSTVESGGEELGQRAGDQTPEDVACSAFLFSPVAVFSSDPHSVPVQLRTTGLLGAAASQRAGTQLGKGGHASCRAFCTGGASAPGMGAAMGGDPSKVAASVFCTATLDR